MSSDDVEVELFKNVDVVSNRHFVVDIFDIFSKFWCQIIVGLLRIQVNFRELCHCGSLILCVDCNPYLPLNVKQGILVQYWLEITHFKQSQCARESENLN